LVSQLNLVLSADFFQKLGSMVCLLFVTKFHERSSTDD
jgi:hypothetical protein